MSRRSKALLIILAVIGAVLAVAYAAAPAILSAIAAHALSSVVEVRELRIETVGLTEVDVAVMDVDNSQMRFNAQDAAIRYRLWPFSIRGVDIKQARLTVANVAVANRSATGPVSFPVPPFPLRIEALTIQGNSPWGAVKVPASVSTKAGAAGGLVAEVRTADFLLSLGNPAENRQTLRIASADGTLLLSLNAALSGGYPVDFDGRVNPGAAIGRFLASPEVPSGLKTGLRPFNIAGGDLRFGGALKADLDLSADVQGSLKVSDQRSVGERLFDSVEVHAPSGYEITRTGSSWSGSGDAEFKVSLNAQTTLTGRQPAWHWHQDGFAFSAVSPRLEQLGLGADTMDIAGAGGSGSGAQGDVNIKGFRTATWPKELSRYDVTGNWSLRGTSFQARGKGKGPALPDLNWMVETSGTRGSVEVTVHDSLAALSPGLQKYAANMVAGLKISAGKLNGRYVFKWAGAGRQTTTLSASAAPVDADVDQMQVRGMEIRLANQGNAIDRLGVAVSAPTLKLGAGVVGQQAELKLNLAYPLITVDVARIKLFSGEIALRPTSIDLDKDKFALLVDVDGVSLEKIIKLLDLKSTELTGRVSGPVRVVYDKDLGIEINQGDLHNIEPGVLKLDMNEHTQAASQFSSLALKALQNFHYKELKTSLVYKPDGQYRIAARIVGDNPNVLGGHSIAFNPTITGRLPALFRAFFITGDFDRAIIETLQKGNGLSTLGETPSLKGH